jgi:aspartyl-tRNA synthetase
MGFAGSIDVMRTVEDLLLKAVWPNVAGLAPLQGLAQTTKTDDSAPGHPDLVFRTLTYETAMRLYGSDKPDTRLGSKIRRIDDWLPADAKRMISSTDDPIVEMVKIDLQGCAPNETKKWFSSFAEAASTASYSTDLARSPGIAVYDPAQPLHGLSYLGHEGAAKVEEEFDPQPGDLFVFWSREDKPFSGGSTVLGDLRRDLYQSALSNGLITAPAGFAPLWIVDFPLFSPRTDAEIVQGSSHICSTHHPFTAPKIQDQDLSVERFKTDPLSIIGDHYDLVINGVEVGGGSRRIHHRQMQRFILSEVLGMSQEDAKANFQHLLEALAAGCPPHAGFALGFDRLMAMLTDCASVRDVIAFPKTADGQDKMVGSPRWMPPQSLQEYHLRTTHVPPTGAPAAPSADTSPGPLIQEA